MRSLLYVIIVINVFQINIILKFIRKHTMERNLLNVINVIIIWLVKVLLFIISGKEKPIKYDQCDKSFSQREGM